MIVLVVAEQAGVWAGAWPSVGGANSAHDIGCGAIAGAVTMLVAVIKAMMTVANWFDNGLSVDNCAGTIKVKHSMW